MEKLKKYLKQFLVTVGTVFFWVFIWFLMAEKIDKSIFLPKPEETFHTLIKIVSSRLFFDTVKASFVRIMKGFLLAVVSGCSLAALSYFFVMIKVLLAPVMRLIKAVPVASFTILALLWVDSVRLSELVAFVIVLPVIYINVLGGLESVKTEMLELAKVFRVSVFRKIRFLYIPAVFPAFTAACRIGLGFCFKAGIAAEVIGRPIHSIGGQLYEAKLYLMTEELFAWTIVIVLLSMMIEGICIYILNRVCERMLHVKRLDIQQGRKRRRKNSLSSDIQQDKERQGETSEHRIVLKNVGKNYSRHRVLADVSFEMKQGDRLCIMGESGAGKTTLLKMIMGLIRQDSGETDIDRSLKMAAVFQESRLIEDTDIYTNIYFACGSAAQTAGGAFDEKKAALHLTKVGLSGLGEKMVNELSGGMKRRVEIVRAVMSEPELLLLDEAFNGLDSDTKKLVAEYLDEFCAGKMIIMVTHHKEEAALLNAGIYSGLLRNGDGNEYL